MVHFHISRRLVAIGCLLLPLAGCMGAIQEPKQPVITYEPISHDVFYTRNMVLPTNAEEALLIAFLKEKTSYNPDGNIALLTSSSTDAVNQERLSDLRHFLADHGYADSIIIEDSTVPAGRVRVRASKVRVQAPDCPDWTYGHMANYRNSLLSNYGCAHATALSKMVLDPNDLVAGKGDAHPDAVRSAGVVEAYHAPIVPEAPASEEPLIQGQ